MLKLFRKNTSTYSTKQILRWLWNILRFHKVQVCLNTLLFCLTVGLDFTFIWQTKRTIDIATHSITGDIRWAAVALAGILISQLAVSFASRWTRAILGVKAQNMMQKDCFDRLLHSEWKERNQRHSGDILNRLERDVRDVVTTVTETVPSIVAVCFRLLGAFCFLYSMDAGLACVTIIIIPFFMLLSNAYIRKMRTLTREVRQTDSRIQSLLQESIQHQMIIQTLEQQDTVVGRLSGIQRHLHRQVKRRTRFSSVSATMMGAGFMTCYLVAFLWGANRLYEGTITYGMMIAFIQLVGQVQGPFRDMTRFIPVLINTFTAGERLMQLEEIPLEKDSNDGHIESHAPGIRFDNVTYSYVAGGKDVLKGFSFDFPPQSHTAIIGETGTGKTTLIRLMLSLIHPTEGEVVIYDNNNVVPCSATTRSHFTYVPQGNTLFSGTIRDNLLYGNPEATEEEMNDALKKACAHFVFSLPDGLDTKCNEQGVGLSEGQAQRIAIARALLRPSGILLLDEATSSLDCQTEKELWQNITSHCKDMTLIFITHRDSIITPETRTLKLD